MKVLKFGGSSVGTTNGIRNVKKIVSSQKGQVIVVVSALGGVTDQLIKTAQMASVGNKAYEDELCVLTNRHYDLINDNITTGNKRDELLAKVEQLLGELRDIFQGIYLIKDLSRKTNDTILSYGERLSSLIVAEVTGAAWKDSREFIKTETTTPESYDVESFFAKMVENAAGTDDYNKTKGVRAIIFQPNGRVVGGQNMYVTLVEGVPTGDSSFVLANGNTNNMRLMKINQYTGKVTYLDVNYDK